MGVSKTIDMNPKARRTIKELLQRHLPGVTVWAYGSRVKWTARPDSDLDLVVFANQERRSNVANLREAFEESNLPFRVDVFIWNEMPEKFREEIREEYMVVQGEEERNQEKKEKWLLRSVRTLQDSGIILVEDGNHGEYRPLPNEFTDHGTAFIRAADMAAGRVLFESAQCINGPASKRVRKGIGAPQDVLLSHKGTVGKVAYVNDAAPSFVCSPQTTFWRSLDHRRLGPRYLYYYLCSNFFQNQLDARKNETDMAGYVSLTAQRSLQVILPPIQDQILIVEHLGTLDDKIELNRHMNQTLEAMAQAIFKSWFVDFDPVKAKQAAKALSRDPERAAMAALSGKLNVPKNPADLSVDDFIKAEAELDQLGEEEREQLERTAALFPDGFVESELGLIPEGWEIVSFADLAVLDTTSVKPYEAPHNVWEHYSIPAYDEHQLPAFEEGTEIKSNKYLVRSQAVLSSKLNPQFPRTWWPIVFDAEAAICSTEFMQFIPILATDRAFIYCMVISNSFQAGISQRVSGSTGSRQRAKPKEVATMKVIDPGKDLRAVFSKKTLPMIEKAKQGFVQSKVLTQLRDTLLPKLLSGEISLCETEVQTEEALP